MIGRSSRYAGSILYTDGGGELLGARPAIDTSPRADDRFHTVVDGDRLDVLAERYLGRVELWWVLADYNEIDWPLELQSGQLLRIPSIEKVSFQIE